MLRLVDDRCDGRYDTDIVASQNLERSDKLAACLAGPAGADDAVGVALTQVAQVLAVGAVNLDGAVTGDESLDAVAKDGVAAF